MYELNCYTIKHLFNSQKDFHLSVEIFLLLIIQSLPLDGLQGHSCPTLCHRLLCSCTLSISPSVSAGMFLSGFFAPFSCSCGLFSSTLPLSHRCHHCLWWVQPWPWQDCLRALSDMGEFPDSLSQNPAHANLTH